MVPLDILCLTSSADLRYGPVLSFFFVVLSQKLYFWEYSWKNVLKKEQKIRRYHDSLYQIMTKKMKLNKSAEKVILNQENSAVSEK